MKQQDRTLHDLEIKDSGSPSYKMLDNITLEKLVDHIIDLMKSGRKPP